MQGYVRPTARWSLVFVIAHYRVTDGSKLNTDLMIAPRMQGDLKQGKWTSARHPPIAKPRFFGPLGASGHDFGPHASVGKKMSQIMLIQ